MEKIKFTIIVPVYNVEKYIEKCIYSILKQSYTNFELLVINDGSTDSSIDKINIIKDKRIKIINKKNGGLSDARNYGINHATGDYIWFIDGDDYIDEKSLEYFNKILSKKTYDIVAFRLIDVINDKCIIENDRFFGNDSKKILMFANATSRIFNKDFFVNNKYSFTKGIYYEDLELIPFIMAQTNNIYYLDKGLYYYVQREGSIMNNKFFSKKKDDKFNVIDSLIDRFKKSDNYDNYKDELEYLTIFHLISVYSCELFKYSRKIYLPRCKKVLSYLDNMNNEWYKNKYLSNAPFLSRSLTFLFRKKCFYICSIVIKLLNIRRNKI